MPSDISTDPQNLAQRLLDVINDDILPLTKTGVSKGNKIFGAALLHKNNLDTFLAETNNEIENPLWHGEMHALKKFYEIPAANRPPTSDLLFLSTHEPCSLCLSAITWCGFDNFYYFFSHEESRDEFSIPHDIKILQEVFGSQSYQKENAFWTSCGVYDLITLAKKEDSLLSRETLLTQESLLTKAQSIKTQYAALSESYQDSKAENDIPLN